MTAMDDMTKDMIPRNAVEYCLRKETVSTNPEAYKAHKKFIGYMDDPEISQFGHWMMPIPWEGGSYEQSN